MSADRSRHPLRRRRHAPVAAVARDRAQAVHAAAGRRDAARQDRASRALARPGVARPRHRHQPRLLLPHQGRLRGARRRASRATPPTCSSRSAATPRRRSRSPRCCVQARYGDDAVMLVLAADHLIRDEAAFAAAVAARRGSRATAGSSPSASRPRIPETGFGYIECGSALGEPRVRRRRASSRSRRSRKARGLPRGRQLRLELRHVRVHRRAPSSRRSRATRPRCCDAVRPVWQPLAARRRRSDARDRRRDVRRRARHLDRLRGDGKGGGRRQGRRRARRLRLERRRLVAGDVGTVRRRRRTATAAAASAWRSTRAARSSTPRTASSPRSASRTWSSSTRPTRCWSRTAITCSASRKSSAN